MFTITAENRKWWILGAMGGVMSVILLDETVVGVALPTLRNDLGVTQVAAHWVINAYLLVFAVLAATGGRLGDIFGHRGIFIVGVAIFGLASLACGFAGSGGWLITLRAIQGIGAAILFPISFAMITIVFPPEQRGLAFGIYAAIGTAALALGPLVGGFFTYLLSWRWIFWINPPIVVLIGLVVLMAWREPAREGPAERIDFPGLLALSAGLGILVFALMQGPEWGWGRPLILALLAAAPLLLIVFTLIERRVAAPLLDVSLFAVGTFTVSNLTIFTAQFNQMIIVIFGALYFQDVLQMSPLMAGTALLVGVGAAPLAAVPTGHLADRLGARPVVLGGLVLATAGQLWTGLAVGWNNYALLVPGLLAWGLANCPLFTAPRRAIMNRIPPSKQGQASGIAMTAQLLGGTIGVAVCGTLYTTTQSFAAVFLTTAGLNLVVLALAWFYIQGSDRKAKA